MTYSRVFQYVGIICICTLFGGGYWYWNNTQAGGTVNDKRPVFEAPLKTNIDAVAGNGRATFTRADGADKRATVTDFEGIVRSVRNGEARFEGARRVENINPKSEADSAWSGFGTTPPTVQTSVVYQGKTAVSATFASGLNGYATTRASGSGFTVNLGSTYRNRFTVSADRALTGSESIQVYITGVNGMTSVGFSTAQNLSTSWATYSSVGSIATNGGTNTFVVYPSANLSSPITIYITERQIEDVSGQSNQNPSEYVSTGVLAAAPYHGANVDGVKYFDYQNGNTLSGNAVIETKGTAIADATLHGYMAEGGRTNLALKSEIFDVSTTVYFSGSPTAKFTTGETVNASGGGSAVAVYHYSASTTYMRASNQTGNFTGTLTGVTSGAVATISSTSSATVYWTPTNLSATNGELSLTSSPGGNTYIPNTLTATSGNGTLLQSVTSASANRTFSVWLKRKTGTGNIDLTVDNGATWTTQTITSSWARYTITQTSVTNPVIGIRIVTSGDAVYVWGAQLESADFASSYIPTSTASVSRAADSLAYSTSNIPLDGFSVNMEFASNSTDLSSGPSAFYITSPGSADDKAIQTITGSQFRFVSKYGGSTVSDINTGTWVAGQMTKVSARFFANSFSASVAGGAVSTDGAGSYSNNATALFIGSNGGSQALYGTTKNVRIWKKSLSDADLQNLTSATDVISNSVIQRTANTAPNSTSLAAYWSFDEGSGTQAEDFSSTGSNTGTLSGSPTWGDGRVGKALNFDGVDDFMNAGSSTSLDTPADYTISLWVYNGAGSDAYPTLFNRVAQVANNGYFWAYTNGTNEADLNFQYADGTNYLTTTFSSALSLNAWQHVVFTFDDASKALKLYINGSQFSTTRTLTNSLSVDDGTLYIGTYDGSTTNYSFQGSLDEFRLYKRTLSAEEVSSLYRQSAATIINRSQNTQMTDGLVGLWSFNGADVSGTTAYDRSGQGNNGTLIGSPTPIIGKVGQALQFNGSTQYVNLPALPSVVAPYSISLWMKPAALVQGAMISLIGSNAYPRFNFHGNYKLLAYAGDEKYRYSTKVFSTSDLNQWWHVVFVVADSSSLANWKVYINGVDDTGAAGGNSGTYYEPSASGALGNYASNYFNGTLDEIRIYNRVLSAVEVTSLYNQGR